MSGQAAGNFVHRRSTRYFDTSLDWFSRTKVLRIVVQALMTLASAFLALLAAAVPAQVPANSILPSPTGPWRVGRITYDWIDSSRAAFLDSTDQNRREVVVDVWYPTDATAGSASYLPYMEKFSLVMPDSIAQRRFAPAYAAVKQGVLSTHAKEGAPVKCSATSCPLLTFSHGGGVDRSSYTAQYEELASHGYIVAAIAHTGDTHRVVFPDGRSIGAPPPPPPLPDPPEWRTLPPMRRGFLRSERNADYGRRVIRIEADDIRFVIDRMIALANAPASPFVGMLDTAQIGALGHSAGGMAAALTCQLDVRIKACLNEDGAMGNLPFDRDARGFTLSQPFLYLTRPYNRPAVTDSLIASLQTTRAELTAHLDWLQTRPDSLLAEMPQAWRVTLRIARLPHMGFSDEPLIMAGADSSKRYDALRALRYTNVYTLAFFAKYLRGDRNTVLDRPLGADSAVVSVERFGGRR
jgi:predicted dienelactone hydrolase